MLAGARMAKGLTRASMALAMLVLAFAQLPYLSAVMQPADEGYIAAFAWRMADGRMLPYVDAVSHRGPLAYFPPALLTLVMGHGFLSVRISAIACLVASALLVYAIGARERPEIGGVAALVYAAIVGLRLEATQGIAYNSEHPLNVLALAGFAVLAATLAKERPRSSALALAGALTASAMLCKQVAGPLVPLFGAWVLAAAIARQSL